MAIASGRGPGARVALIDGPIGFAVQRDGVVVRVLSLTIEGERIVAIDALADPQRLVRVDIVLLD